MSNSEPCCPTLDRNIQLWTVPIYTILHVHTSRLTMQFILLSLFSSCMIVLYSNNLISNFFMTSTNLRPDSLMIWCLAHGSWILEKKRILIKKWQNVSPEVGLEPTTLGLRVPCSTDWATRAVDISLGISVYIVTLNCICISELWLVLFNFHPLNLVFLWQSRGIP